MDHGPTLAGTDVKAGAATTGFDTDGVANVGRDGSAGADAAEGCQEFCGGASGALCMALTGASGAERTGEDGA